MKEYDNVKSITNNQTNANCIESSNLYRMKKTKEEIPEITGNKNQITIKKKN